MKTVLFSGGFDSTYELQYLMRDIHENKSSEKVNIVIVEPDFGGTKLDRDKEAREKILKYLQAKYYNCKTEVNILGISIEKFKIKVPGLCQPLFWLPTLLLSLDPDENNTIYFSYILGDQASIFKTEIENIVNNAVSLHRNNYEYMGSVSIEFPLIMKDKKEILTDLLFDDEWLFDNCTCCEEPYDTKDNCGKCVPCTHLKEALVSIILDDDYEISKRQKCKETLYDRFGIDLPFSIHKKEQLVEDINEEREKYIDDNPKR